jgi:hypothetical protein
MQIYMPRIRGLEIELNGEDCININSNCSLNRDPAEKEVVSNLYDICDSGENSYRPEDPPGDIAGELVKGRVPPWFYENMKSANDNRHPTQNKKY